MIMTTALAIVMSYANTERLWIAEGGSKFLAPTLAAIANAESHLHFGTANYDKHELGGSFCGWQINLVHTTKKGGPFDKEKLLKDPRYCAKAAVYVAKHQGLRAWTTYREGTYLSFMRKDDPTPEPTTKPRVTPQQFMAYVRAFHHAPPKNWQPHDLTDSQIAHMNVTWSNTPYHQSQGHRTGMHRAVQSQPLNEFQIVLAGLLAVFLASNLVRLGVMMVRRIEAQEEAYRRRTRRRSVTERPLRHRRQVTA